MNTGKKWSNVLIGMLIILLTGCNCGVGNSLEETVTPEGTTESSFATESVSENNEFSVPSMSTDNTASSGKFPTTVSESISDKIIKSSVVTEPTSKNTKSLKTAESTESTNKKNDFYGIDLPYYADELVNKSLNDVIKGSEDYFEISLHSFADTFPENHISITNEYVYPGLRFYIGEAMQKYSEGAYGYDDKKVIAGIKKDLANGVFKHISFITVEGEFGNACKELHYGMYYNDVAKVVGKYEDGLIGGQMPGTCGQYIYNCSKKVKHIFAFYEDTKLDDAIVETETEDGDLDTISAEDMKRINPKVKYFVVEPK